MLDVAIMCARLLMTIDSDSVAALTEPDASTQKSDEVKLLREQVAVLSKQVAVLSTNQSRSVRPSRGVVHIVFIVIKWEICNVTAVIINVSIVAD